MAEKRLDKSLAERRLEKAKAELAATRAREVSTGSPEQSHGSENTAEQLVELQSSLDNERTRRKQVEVSLEQARAVNKELEERSKDDRGPSTSVLEMAARPLQRALARVFGPRSRRALGRARDR